MRRARTLILHGLATSRHVELATTLGAAQQVIELYQISAPTILNGLMISFAE
jgi:hypothetical protein